MLLERFDEIKAAVSNPVNATMYPYTDPAVQDLMKIGMWINVEDVRNIRIMARMLGNANIKFSELLLHQAMDMDKIIEQLIVMQTSMRIYSLLSDNPAVKDYVTICEEGMKKNIEWLTEIKERKDAGERWSDPESPLQY